MSPSLSSYCYDTFVFTVPHHHQQQQQQQQHQDMESHVKRLAYATDSWIARLFPYGGYNDPSTGRKRVKGREGQVGAVYVAKWTYSSGDSGRVTKNVRYEIVERSDNSILLFYTPDTGDMIWFKYPPVETKMIPSADGRSRDVEGIPIRLSWTSTSTDTTTLTLVEPKPGLIRWCSLGTVFVLTMTIGIAVIDLFEQCQLERQHRNEQHEGLRRYFST